MTPMVSNLLSGHETSMDWWDVIPAGVYACDADGRILQYNRNAARVWGQEPSKGLSDQQLFDSFPMFQRDGRPAPEVETPISEALRTGHSVHDTTLQFMRRDGSCAQVLVSIDPLTDDEGRVRGAIASMQEIGERHRPTSARGAGENGLVALLEALPAAVYTTDANGCVTFYNRAAERLAGRSPEIGSDRWCVSWRLYWPDGRSMEHEDCPMATALKQCRALFGKEAVAERPDGTRVPFLAYPTPLFDETGKLAGAINMLIDITDRKKSENAQRLLLNELNHRVKNTLASVQSIARQTMRHTSKQKDFVESFAGRVNALAAAHTLLTRETWEGADLMELVRVQLAIEKGSRICAEGPEVRLGPQMALHLGLVLHELGTNARKYGALSVPEGRVRLVWTVSNGVHPTLRIVWRESGGPRVETPSRRGFGSTLIESSLNAEQGESELIYDPAGLVCTIALSLPHAASAAPNTTVRGAGQAPAGLSQRERDRLVGCRVLVVEDEPLVAMDIESMLNDAGLTVVGPAGNHRQAVTLARESEFDLALLDANLSGRSVEDVAAILAARNVPFAFASGYGREGLPPGFADVPLVAKPFSMKTLLDCLHELWEGRGASGQSVQAADGAGAQLGMNLKQHSRS